MSGPEPQGFTEVATGAADVVPGPLGVARPAVRNEQATLILDSDGLIRYCSRDGARLFGASAEQLLDTSIAALIPDLVLDDGDKAPARRWLEDKWRRYRGIGRDGSPLLLDAALDKLSLAAGHILVMTLARAAAPPREDDDLQRLLSRLERSSAAAVITDKDGIIEHVNPAFVAMTGYSREQAVGRSTRILKSGVHPPEFYADLWATIRSGKEFAGVLVNRRRNGELYHEEKRIREFVDAMGNATHYVSTGRDVSGRSEALDRLERMDNFDRVTGMPARHLFLDRLEQTLIHASRRGTGAGVICVDLDDFKSVNERHGRGVGDALLRAVAHRLRECVRNEDTVARLRSDQFALILVDAAEVGAAEKVLQKIVASFGRSFRVGAEKFNVSASVGACLFPNQARDKRSLLAGADAAMHRAKAAGGNGYRFCAEEGSERDSELPMRKRRVSTPCA